MFNYYKEHKKKHTNQMS